MRGAIESRSGRKRRLAKGEAKAETGKSAGAAGAADGRAVVLGVRAQGGSGEAVGGLLDNPGRARGDEFAALGAAARAEIADPIRLADDI